VSSILSVLNEPWAIQLDKKHEMDSIYKLHLKGDKIDLKGLEAKIGRPLGNQKSFEVVNGDALIPVEGVISKRISLLHDISGGTSTEALAQQFQQAMSDPTVERVILMVDSPGGSVDGTKAIGDMIFAARGTKPIVAWVDGLAASAAYWIASAADQIFLRDETAFVGSIGVVATHVDRSGAEAKDGEVYTDVTAGKFKRIDSSHAPLSEEGFQSIQDRVDGIYGVFLADVGRNRGALSAEQVHDQMADGRLFMGQDAITAGLVDGISSLDNIVMSKKPKKPNMKKGPTMNIDTLKAEHPEVFQAALDLGAAGGGMVMCPDCGKKFDPGKHKAEAEAANAEITAAETARVKGVLEAALPGYEDLAMTLALDGKTTPGDAALAMSGEEKKRRAAEALIATDEAVKPLKTVGKDDVTEETDLKARWNSNESLRKLYSNDFAKYEKAEALRADLVATGRVRAYSPNLNKK
jgi:signal peptide peptidase SppA